MAYPELNELPLRDCWIAIDPRGDAGIARLRTGGVVVDFDERLDDLCRRVCDARRTPLTIVYCGERPRA